MGRTCFKCVCIRKCLHVCAKIRTKVWALMCLTAIHCLVEFFFRIPLCQFFFGFGFDLGTFGALQKAFADGKYAISTKSYFFPYSHLSYPNSLSRSLYFCFFVSVLPLQLHILCVYAILWMACTLLWSHWTRWNKSFAREWKGKNQRTNRKSAKNVNKVYVNVALKRTNEPEYSVTPCTLPCILAMDKNRERKKAFASK